MIQNNPTNVTAAFEMLLEEVEAEIEFFNEVGKAAIEKRDYERVSEAISHATNITSFREKIAALGSEWEKLSAAFKVEPEEEEQVGSQRRNLGRLSRGIRTPDKAFREPILSALIELDGSGNVGDVLDLVEKRMKKVLKKVDFQPLASDPSNLRWRNAAQWCRNNLVKAGLMKSDSPRGVWEITDEGRTHLEKR